MEPSVVPPGGGNQDGMKMKRHRFTADQMRLLKTAFEQNPMPSTAELRVLSESSGVPLRSCRLWFKNRRARTPGKHTSAAPRDALSASVQTGSAEALSSSASLPGVSSSPPLDALPWNGSLETSRSHMGRGTLDADGLWDVSLQLGDTAPTSGMNQPKRPRERGHVNNRSLRVREAGRPGTLPYPSAAQGHGGQMMSQSMATSKALTREPLDTLSSFWNRLPSRAEPPAIMQSPHRSTAMRIPSTPRLLSQRVYEPGERVELLEFVGAARAWCPARIVSANVSWPSATDSLLSAVEIAQDDGIDRVCEYDGISPLTKTAYEILFISAEEALSVHATRASNLEHSSRSPESWQTPALHAGAASAGPHRVVLGARLRPCPPAPPTGWRPNIGDAVEALVPLFQGRDRAPTPAVMKTTLKEGQTTSAGAGDRLGAGAPSSAETGQMAGQICCWTVGQVRNFLARKGFLVAFADSLDEWFHLDQLRPYAIWRGADRWQVKSKAPTAVVRRAVSAAPAPEQISSRSNADQANDSTVEAAKRLAALNAQRSLPAVQPAGTGPAPSLHSQLAATTTGAPLHSHRAWYTREPSERDESERLWSEDDEDEDEDDLDEGVYSGHHGMARDARSEPDMHSSSTSPLTSPLAAAAWNGKRPGRFSEASIIPSRKGRNQRLVARERRRPRGPRNAAKETLRADHQAEIVAGQGGLVVGAGASDRRHRGGRKPSLTLTLPPGWRLEEQIRKGGSLAGRIDRVYVSPDGRRFRSLKEVARFLDR
jgi:hypothetical protein